MSSWRIVLALGFAHAVADAISGFTAASLVGSVGLLRIGGVILLYNVITFALQPLFGYIVDRWARPMLAAAIGIFLVAIGFFVFFFFPMIGFMIIAVGSGFFHVGAGAVASLATPQKSIGAAIFTAPGVMGLSFGMVAGMLGWAMAPWLLGAVSITVIVLFVIARQLDVPNVAACPDVRKESDLEDVLHERYTLVLIFLLIIVALRSTIWTIYGATAANIDVILAFGIVAGLGKLVGGYAADRFGSWHIIGITALLSLLCFPVPSFLFLLLGIFFLQSSTPIILATAVQTFPRYAATIAGCVLGFAIAVGGFLAWILIN